MNTGGGGGSLRSESSVQDLYWLAPSSPGEEEVKDSALGHDVHSGGGQDLLDLPVGGARVEHGGPEHGGKVVVAHLVVSLHAGHPHQVLDQEDDAGLARVLRQLREEMEVGSRSLGFVLDRVSFEKLRIRFAGEYTLWQIPAVNIMSYM